MESKNSKKEDINNNTTNTKNLKLIIPKIITASQNHAPSSDENTVELKAASESCSEVTVVNVGGRPTMVRRRSSGTLASRRAANDVKSELFLKEPDFNHDLRRNSYGGRSYYDDETQVVDGFLTTSLCSTEL